jgi:hypothetical protein
MVIERLSDSPEENYPKTLRNFGDNKVLLPIICIKLLYPNFL